MLLKAVASGLYISIYNVGDRTRPCIVLLVVFVFNEGHRRYLSLTQQFDFNFSVNKENALS